MTAARKRRIASAALVLLTCGALLGCGMRNARPAPTIDCRQAAPRAIEPLPAADEWVEWQPPTPERPNGLARLSERAAQWVAGTLVAATRERGLWAAQERCLDNYEKAGAIRR